MGLLSFWDAPLQRLFLHRCSYRPAPCVGFLPLPGPVSPPVLGFPQRERSLLLPPQTARTALQALSARLPDVVHESRRGWGSCCPLCSSQCISYSKTPAALSAARGLSACPKLNLPPGPLSPTLYFDSQHNFLGKTRKPSSCLLHEQPHPSTRNLPGLPEEQAF